MRLSPAPVPAPLVPFVTPPPLSAWTWINQGPYDDPTDYPLQVTAADIPGGVRFQVPGPTNWPALIVANDPLPEPPYTITAFVRTGVAPYESELGLAIHNSDSGETLTWWVAPEGYFGGPLWRRDNITTELFDYAEAGGGGSNYAPINENLWLRIQNDGSTVHFYTSLEGISFVELIATDVHSLGSFDQYGFSLYNILGVDSSIGPPWPEAYSKNAGAGRLVADLLSVEVVPELVDTTTFR